MRCLLPILFFLLLVACSTVPVTSPPPPAEQAPTIQTQPAPPISDQCVAILRGAESTCPRAGTVQVADLSMAVDQRFLDVAKCLGVRLIVRYGDYPKETIAGKTPKAPELALLKLNGMEFLAVFQHNNSKIESFTTARGEADARRMQELYQNAGAFYFGADGEFSTSADQAAIKIYATAFSKVARSFGKRVGVYGAGITLKNLKAAGLTDYHWLANATGWTGSAAFAATGAWVMKQGLPKKCGGKEADFGVINPAFADLGAWKL